LASIASAGSVDAFGAPLPDLRLEPRDGALGLAGVLGVRRHQPGRGGRRADDRAVGEERGRPQPPLLGLLGEREEALVGHPHVRSAGRVPIGRGARVHDGRVRVAALQRVGARGDLPLAGPHDARGHRGRDRHEQQDGPRDPAHDGAAP
jgi:hypothetical protein